MNERFLKLPLSEIRLLPKIKWDIYSPRFAMAQLNLGLKDEDLMLLDISQFKKPGIDEQIVKMRFDHHLLKLKNNLNGIIE